MYNIKKINKEYVNRRIQRNPELANDTTHSNSNVSLIMMIGFVLRTVKLMITVASFSYFIGMGWILMCDVILRFELLTDDDQFLVHFGIDQREPMHQTYIAVYFAFTSLSTVGFGDYHPRSNVERLVGAAMLTFGVAIFSVVMSQFIEMIDKIKNFTASLD